MNLNNNFDLPNSSIPINEKLLSYVLGLEIIDIQNGQLINDSLKFTYLTSLTRERKTEKINIYKLTHLIKTWAFELGFEITTHSNKTVIKDIDNRIFEPEQEVNIFNVYSEDFNSPFHPYGELIAGEILFQILTKNNSNEI